MKHDIVEWSILFQNQVKWSGLNIGASQQRENLLKRGLTLGSLFLNTKKMHRLKYNRTDHKTQLIWYVFCDLTRGTFIGACNVRQSTVRVT